MLELPESPLAGDATGRTAGQVRLREVRARDLALFYRHQVDAEAAHMAAFPPRNEHDFFLHWQRVLRNARVIKRTIVHDARVAGNIVGFEEAGRMLIGYWLGRDHWGRGVATRALRQFLELVTQRPVYAFVAKRNRASLRVLQKCGFEIVDEGHAERPGSGEAVPELALVLRAPVSDSRNSATTLRDAP